MLKKVALAVAAALAAQAASAASIDFHGYMRAQVGGTSEGGNLQCFHLGYPAPSKFRLGNECDNYAEMAFDTKLYKGTDGVWANYHLRLGLRDKGAHNFEAAGGAMNNNGPISGTDNRTVYGQNDNSNAFEISARENWVEAGGFFGGPVMQNAKVWVGKRFYNRHDVNINDWYYWANTNPGAGIEGIEFGPLKFAYAYTQQGGNSSQNNSTGAPVFPENGASSRNAQKVHEFRLYDIPVNPNGKLEAAVAYLHGSSVDLENTPAVDESAGDESGYRLTLQHVQSNLLGGYNKLAVIYGKDNGAGLGWMPDYAGNQNSGTTWQVVEQLYASAGNFSGMATVQFLSDKDRPGNGPEAREYFAVGVRPQYNFTENFSLAVEASYEQADLSYRAQDPKLAKLTGALQLAAGKGFWARPVFRLFATYATWNEGAAANNLDSSTNNVFSRSGEDGDGITYGAQVEAWW